MRLVNRLAAILTLALLAAFGASTRAVAKVHVGQNIASRGFAANYDRSAPVDGSQTLDFAEETSAYGYELASGQSKWPSRDPIGERGGLNLYGMVGNDPVNFWDYLGLNTCHIWVYLPENRSNLGTMYVYDHGNTLIYTAPVRGAGTHSNPLKTNGDTPTGDYTGTPLNGPMGNEGANGPYGNNAPMRLTGTPYSNQPALGGEACECERPGLLIHGGRQDRAQKTQVKVKLWDMKKQKWIEQTVNRPSNTFGCLRIDEGLASEFIGTIKSESCCTEWNVHVREGAPPANPSTAPAGP
jgi:hypothetical protein